LHVGSYCGNLPSFGNIDFDFNKALNPGYEYKYKEDLQKAQKPVSDKINEIKQLIADLINTLIFCNTHSITLPQGGASKTKIILKATGETYIVRLYRSKQKYIMKDKQKVYLKTLKNKYKYLKFD